MPQFRLGSLLALLLPMAIFFYLAGVGSLPAGSRSIYWSAPARR
jgi:hypothetical protein